MNYTKKKPDNKWMPNNITKEENSYSKYCQIEGRKFRTYKKGRKEVVYDNEVGYAINKEKLKQTKRVKKSLSEVCKFYFDDLILKFSEISKWKFFHSSKLSNAGVKISYEQLKDFGKLDFFIFIKPKTAYMPVGIVVLQELIYLMKKKNMINGVVFTGYQFTNGACDFLEQNKSMLCCFEANWLEAKSSKVKFFVNGKMSKP